MTDTPFALPPPDASEEEILGRWRMALVDATIAHFQLGPHPYASSIKLLREGREDAHWDEARADNGAWWASWLAGRDITADTGHCVVLPNQGLSDAWLWLTRWWNETYLPRHADIALREMMSDLSCLIEFSSWLPCVEDIAWRLLQLEDPHAWLAGFASQKPDDFDVAKLRRFHEEAGGWWMAPPCDSPEWEPFFVTTNEWLRHLSDRVESRRLHLPSDVLIEVRSHLAAGRWEPAIALIETAAGCDQSKARQFAHDVLSLMEYSAGQIGADAAVNLLNIRNDADLRTALDDVELPPPPGGL